MLGEFHHELREGIGLERKSISAREGGNVILVSHEIKPFRRLN